MSYLEIHHKDPEIDKRPKVRAYLQELSRKVEAELSKRAINLLTFGTTHPEGIPEKCKHLNGRDEKDYCRMCGATLEQRQAEMQARCPHDSGRYKGMCLLCGHKT